MAKSLVVRGEAEEAVEAGEVPLAQALEEGQGPWRTPGSQSLANSRALLH